MAASNPIQNSEEFNSIMKWQYKGDINNRTKWLLDIINVLWPEIDKIKI